MSLWPIGRLLDSLDTGGVIAIDTDRFYEDCMYSFVPSSVRFVIDLTIDS